MHRRNGTYKVTALGTGFLADQLFNFARQYEEEGRQAAAAIYRDVALRLDEVAIRRPRKDYTVDHVA